MIYKPKHEMNEGDTVAGVVYAAAAEQVIVEAFQVIAGDDDYVEHDMTNYPFSRYQPTVIGYMVEMNDTEPTVTFIGINGVRLSDGQWLRVGINEARVNDASCGNGSCDHERHEALGDRAEMNDKLYLDDFEGYWSEVDWKRHAELVHKRRLNDMELKELAAINRRLGYDVTSDVMSLNR